jgi:hypothetical protein
MVNENLAYILGVLKGDGHLDENSIVLDVKDIDFALNFKKAVEVEFQKEGKLHFYDNLWRALLHSRTVVKYLKNIDIFHSIRNSSKKAKAAFLRGMFDSEGSAYCNIKYGVTNRKIELCNNDLHLMNLCKELLEELEIKTRKIDKRFRSERIFKGRKLEAFNYYRLTLNENKQNFNLFKKLIGFSIKRKQKNLKRIIDSYRREEYNKWIMYREKVLISNRTKSYTELRKEFHFLPKHVIDHWIYSKEIRVSEE